MPQPIPSNPHWMSPNGRHSSRSVPSLFIAARVATALLGGYAFTWGFTSLGIVALVAMGVDFHDAETGMLLLAFAVFLILFLWAFAATSLVRVWVALGAGGALMIAAAWGLQRALLS